MRWAGSTTLQSGIEELGCIVADDDDADMCDGSQRRRPADEGQPEFLQQDHCDAEQSKPDNRQRGESGTGAHAREYESDGSVRTAADRESRNNSWSTGKPSAKGLIAVLRQVVAEDGIPVPPQSQPIRNRSLCRQLKNQTN